MIRLDGSSLSIEDLATVAAGEPAIELAPNARELVVVGRRSLEKQLGSGEAIYGINTGFGQLSNVRIEPEHLETLQERLILSHAAGMGRALQASTVRIMLCLRANTLAKGHSGVRAEVIERLLAMLAHDVLPVVPRKGSVGASGDLAPLAHLALPLLGHGRVLWKGRELGTAEALSSLGWEPIRLQAKEGLGLINGTQAMAALLSESVLEMRQLVKAADLIGGLSTDALRGTDSAFDRRLHQLRPHPGQLASAANLWQLLQGSGIRESHRQGDVRVQDPYCVRCMPQVHGAVRDVLTDVERKLLIEMNSVTDNPLVFPDDEEILSGGNFHGEPMAIAADYLAIGVSELGAISERRTEKLTNDSFSGLPAFLVQDAGLNSGFMIAHVTAAALASENKTLCHPASVDSVPTSADKEDHVSMGMGGALKLRKVVRNTRRILAIELAAAAQGIDLLRPLTSSEPLEALHRGIRQSIETWDQDREMAPDLQAAENYLRSDIGPLLLDLL